MKLSGRDLRLELRGDDVALLHHELALLGLHVEDADVARQWFGDSTEKAVRTFQDEHQLPPEGVVDERTARSINAAVDQLPDPDAAVWVITGTVVSPRQGPLPGIAVSLFDIGLRTETWLSNGITDVHGDYRITWPRSGTTPPDLQVRATGRDGSEMGCSDTHYNAGPQTRLDLAIDDLAAHGRAELATVMAAVTPYTGADLSDLREDDEHADLSYLANKTGWDARLIALAALASTNAAAVPDDLTADHLYALYRAGVEPEAVARLRPDAVAQVWRQGQADGIAAIGSEMAKPLAALRERSIAQLLQPSPQGSPVASLGDVLALALGHLNDAGTAAAQAVTGLLLDSADEPEQFWEASRQSLGDDTTDRLQRIGTLAEVSGGNLAVMAAVEARYAEASVADLVAAGLHDAAAWESLVKDRVPAWVEGADDQERAVNYANGLAAGLRLREPTATLAAQVASGVLPVDDPSAVGGFLLAHRDRFAVAEEPVERYLKRTDSTATNPVRVEVQRLQRVYQLTKNDTQMAALLEVGLDSAYSLVKLGSQAFVAAHAKALGGQAVALDIMDRANSIHQLVLHTLGGYLSATTAKGVGSAGRGTPIIAAGVVPDPSATWERLFGSTDLCSCDHCRSVLSPAAYLVDLLEFTDRPGVGGKANPLDVLLARRPDLAHLPLSCENTNVALPYIDVVNETLEYFIAHDQSLAGFEGHDTAETEDSIDLLANPKFVDETVYATLLGEAAPDPLPFHRPLELLRRHVLALGSGPAPGRCLADAMTALRGDNAVDRATPTGYGWRDVAMERLGLNRQLYRLLTDSSVPLPELFGFPMGTTPAEASAELSGAKAYCRRARLDYGELIALTKTGFVNPAAALLPRLRHLGVTLATLAQVAAGTITDPDLDALLPAGVDPAEVRQFVTDHLGAARTLIVLNQLPDTDPGDFASFVLGYFDPDPGDHRLSDLDWRRMARLTRIRTALGWSVELTDTAIRALWPKGLTNDAADTDTGFAAMLLRLGTLVGIADRLGVTALESLIAVWGGVDPQPGGLYDKLFASPALLRHDAAFARAADGSVLNAAGSVGNHLEALRSALSVTGAEMSQLIDDLSAGPATALDQATLDGLYQRSWLARTLKLSVAELGGLISVTGYDPFVAPEQPGTGLLALLDLLDALKAANLKPAEWLSLVFGSDPSAGLVGPVEPDPSLVRELRRGLGAVAGEFTVLDDPLGDLARARVALVFGAETADFLFALLDGLVTERVDYAHPQEVLPATIGPAALGRLRYDDLTKTLTLSGSLDPARRAALAGLAEMTAPLLAAIDRLIADGVERTGRFLDRYPELGAPYADYVASTADVSTRRAALVDDLLPTLLDRRRREVALAIGAAQLGIEPMTFAAITTDPAVLKSAAIPGAPALQDCLAIGVEGADAEVFWASSTTGAPNLSPSPGPIRFSLAALRHAGPASVRFTGMLQVDAPGEGYLVALDTDASAVRLRVGGQAVALDHVNTRWRSHDRLTGGGLIDVVVEAETVSTATLVWHVAGQGWAEVPAALLYSTKATVALAATADRIRRAGGLASKLRLTSSEVSVLGAVSLVDGEPWSNFLGSALTASAATQLSAAVGGVLTYSGLRGQLTPDEPARLADVFAGASIEGITGWPTEAVETLLGHLGLARNALADPRTLRRFTEAIEQMRTFGTTAATALSTITNDPDAAQVAAFQAAVRARYAEADWMGVVQPINDELRRLQRDALVASVLRRVAGVPALAHLDSADRLFEYFLSDVSMQPCTQTSRIRHALSCVQLFVDRCLMNLEPEVSPASLPAAQWEWMRRYRVWEAARKVFLWPENWLEPELRDDQSPFFAEALQELLQGEVTEDRAAQAIGGYVGKLAEVANLEPCGMAAEPVAFGEPTLHVISRTPGAKRKYFHRRREGGFWTPWVPIKLDIEDNPVAPVLWKGRLFVVWLRLLRSTPTDKASQSTSGPAEAMVKLPLGALKTSAVNGLDSAAKISIGAILCYSEFSGGEWQATKTSDPDRPALVRTSPASGAGAFDRSKLSLAFDVGETLTVRVVGDGWASFRLFNTYSAPVRFEDLDLPDTWTGGADALYRELGTNQRALTVTKRSLLNLMMGWSIPDESWPVLTGPTPLRAVQVERSGIGAPFLLADAQHCFYVQESQHTAVIGYGSYINSYVASPTKLIWAHEQVETAKPNPWGLTTDEAARVLITDNATLAHSLSEDLYIDKAAGLTSAVRFGGTAIGPQGAIKQTKTF